MLGIKNRLWISADCYAVLHVTVFINAQFVYIIILPVRPGHNIILLYSIIMFFVINI